MMKRMTSPLKLLLLVVVEVVVLMARRAGSQTQTRYTGVVADEV